jgi:hypothetical protein
MTLMCWDEIRSRDNLKYYEWGEGQGDVGCIQARSHPDRSEEVKQM